jgi:hypothetical protein
LFDPREIACVHVPELLKVVANICPESVIWIGFDHVFHVFQLLVEIVLNL